MNKILDPCCGSRMFWFDKNCPGVEFCDNRELSDTLCDGRKLEVKPDVKMDFRDMKFASGSYKLVVFDPPHMNSLGKNSWMAKKYGVLGETWRDDLRKGFSECFRVLEDGGVLVFKWNESDIKVREVLELVGYKPLFGHKSGKLMKTHWITFMKSAEFVQIASKGCGKEWTENACVKTEPDYCGEGDNLCPECEEKHSLNLKKESQDE